jgi:anti-sigma regulatory factor (Ser/Thr protein kinase)
MDRVAFSLPAKPENVALVRHALAGFADVLGMAPAGIADLKTVVTEACANVVLHAYEGEEDRPMDVAAEPNGSDLLIRVRDYGEGIKPRADAGRRSLRLGLPLMAALTNGFELSQSPGGGTTVSLRIPLEAPSQGGQARLAPAVTETRIEINPGETLGPVLARVISMFAARANLTVDRVADAVLLSDAISAGSDGAFAGDVARIAVAEEDDAFEIRVGPLAPGGGRRLLEGMRLPEINASLETLAEEVSVIDEDGRETVVVRLGASTASAV